MEMASISAYNARLFGCTSCAYKEHFHYAVIPFRRLSRRPHKLGFVPLVAATRRIPPYHLQYRRKSPPCIVLSERPCRQKEEVDIESDATDEDERTADTVHSSPANRPSERAARRKAERYTYLFAAVASTVGITSMAAGAVYYRFFWQMQGGEIPFTEMFGTFSLAVGAAIGMEAWARWAHRALWHSALWGMHESHHRPREGPFELNDVFAIINAVPAMGLMGFGFFNEGLLPGLCFGAGLGITVYGVAYMFVHDGLVHRRFPVGPIADVPYLQKVAAAHQLHHADTFDGVPYGLFLGPKKTCCLAQYLIEFDGAGSGRCWGSEGLAEIVKEQ